MTDPTLKPLGSALFVVWPDVAALEFSRIAEHTETVTAEVTVVSQPLGEVAWSRLNLLAGQARKGLADACLKTVAEQDWHAIVDRSCKLVLRHLRAGAPPVPLDAKEPAPDWVTDRWLVPALIPREQISVLYADGGSGKSWLALALAVSGLLGHPLSSTWSVGALRRVLYLDWESDVADHQERLWRLTAGLEPVAPGRILYHRLHRPLTDHVDQLRAEVDREGIDLVITDSLGAACGSEPETNDAALRTFGALRAIPCTHLVLAHVSKAMADAEGPRRPFGGVYVVNTARSTIEARRVDDGDADSLTVTLHHRKTNAGRLAKLSALTFSWAQDTGYVHVNGGTPDMAGASLPVQILDALKRGAGSATVIAEQIGSPPGTVRSILNRLEKRNKVTRIGDSGHGRSKETQWGLRDNGHPGDPDEKA